jgi:mono/diheme cytochrome c family protein
MQQLTHIIRLAAICASLLSATAIAAETIEVPFKLARGQVLYENYCASCHGLELDGSDQGPPLVHPFYKPSHHGDKSFYRAVLQGTKQHHWNFGDMKPVEGMTPKKMDSLLPYVRYFQQQKKLY